MVSFFVMAGLNLVDRFGHCQRNAAHPLQKRHPRRPQEQQCAVKVVGQPQPLQIRAEAIQLPFLQPIR